MVLRRLLLSPKKYYNVLTRLPVIVRYSVSVRYEFSHYIKLVCIQHVQFIFHVYILLFFIFLHLSYVLCSTLSYIA